MSALLQLDMFGGGAEPADPLIGLTVQLPRQCRCGSELSHIGPGSGPHRASLHCARCGHHNGRLPQEAARFLTDVIERFGRPIKPICVRALCDRVENRW
jgi:hypothetical protein